MSRALTMDGERAAAISPFAETARLLLRYDEKTGMLYWKRREPMILPDSSVISAPLAQGWNARRAGQQALTTVNVHGYRHGSVMGRTKLAHRVIFEMVHGYSPDQVDHINHDKLDNRIGNLRAVTNAENCKNISLVERAKYSCYGITTYERKRHGGGTTFMVTIRVDGQLVSVGKFRALDAAVAARKEAERKFGFHENHGAPR